MKTLKLIVLLVLVFLFFYLKVNSPSPANDSRSSSSSVQSSGPIKADDRIPNKAVEVLQTVRSTGLPSEGYVGGRIFQNRERRLPADGDYREFDVDPHHGGRNAERIIVEWRTKKAWYTGDHYQTFIPLP